MTDKNLREATWVLEDFCGDYAHLSALQLFEDDVPDLFLSVQLNSKGGFLKRLWWGLKYVFGYTSDEGHWYTGSFSKESAAILIEAAQRYIDAVDKQNRMP